MLRDRHKRKESNKEVTARAKRKERKQKNEKESESNSETKEGMSSCERQLMTSFFSERNEKSSLAEKKRMEKDSCVGCELWPTEDCLLCPEGQTLETWLMKLTQVNIFFPLAPS